MEKVFKALDEVFRNPQLSREDKLDAHAMIMRYLETQAVLLDGTIDFLDFNDIGFDMFS